MPEATREEAVAPGVVTREGREEGFSFSPERTKTSRKPSQPNGLAMSAVGEVLERARLDQGIDLATIAAITKIKAKYLRALEADDRKSLPGEFFYKSFVHQYAKFLGLNSKPLDAEIDRVLSADSPLPLPSAARQAEVTLSSRSRSARKSLFYAAMVLILVGCYGIDAWWHKSRAPVAENAAPRRAPSSATGRISLASVSQVAAGPAAASVASVARQDEPAPPAGSKVELDLTATEETWLSVSSDGTPVFSGVLEANQTKTIEGKEFAKLRVGNAAGLEVRLNGKPLGPLGAHGQVRDLYLTSEKFPSHVRGPLTQPL
jgi:cytoskeleton protein RodZ